MATLFLLSVALLTYVYVGYPLAMRIRAAWRPRPSAARPIEPAVSVVIVVHNEAARIDLRLSNLLHLDYPPDRLQIILASDGSDDDTVTRARAFEPRGVDVIAYAQRRGKPAVLNAVVPAASGDVVVLADARQRFDPLAIRALVRHFADPRIGAVSGQLVLTDSGDATTAGDGAGFYWRYETSIRRSESRCDSTVGATGAIYAIRRDLFEPIPDDTLLDDVVIPARIMRRGYRVLFEPQARAWDRVPATASEEFVRKVRTIAGNFQLFARERWLLNPWANRLWLQTLSHKGARLLVPVLHAAALGANAALAADPRWRVLLVLQAIFYGMALAGFLLRNTRARVPLIALPYAICLLGWATVVACVRYGRGRQQVTWDRASAS